jgi:hypothetical protein
MYIFIDEPGIHKQIDHSVFSCVYVSVEDIHNLEKEIVAIEDRLKIRAFHWRELPWKLRQSFLIEVVKLPFSVKIAIFKNPTHPQFALEWSLKHLLVERSFYKIIIDGQKPKWVERQIKKILRENNITTNKLKTNRQLSAPGLRLADAFAGVSRAHYDQPNGKVSEAWKVANKKITAQLLGGQVGG